MRSGDNFSSPSSECRPPPDTGFAHRMLHRILCSVYSVCCKGRPSSWDSPSCVNAPLRIYQEQYMQLIWTNSIPFLISSSKYIRFMQRTHSSGVMILHSTLNSESKITVSDWMMRDQMVAMVKKNLNWITKKVKHPLSLPVKDVKNPFNVWDLISLDCFSQVLR